jgi:hypothetical protein
MAAMRVRVRPSVKAAAVRMAQEDNRSMAEWLEWLIEAEAARLDGKKVQGGVRRSPDEASWRNPGLSLAQPRISLPLHPGYGLRVT